MTYKVVKEFDSLKKGELLENSYEAPEIFTFEEDTDDMYRYISYSKSIIDDLTDQGYLIKVDDNTVPEDAEDTICRAIDEIDALVEQYDKDNDEVTEKFANGELPYCAKVEADTVHTNLKKVLEHIRDILTGDEQTRKDN